MDLYKKLLGFLMPHWKTLAAATVCMLGVSLFENISLASLIPFIDKIVADKPIVIPNKGLLPAFVVVLIERINAMPRGVLLKNISIWLVVIYFLKGISVYGQEYLMESLGQRVIKGVREKLYWKLNMLPLSFYSKNKSGGLISRVTYDTTVIKSTVAQGFADLISQSIQLIVSLVTLATITISFKVPGKLFLGLAIMILVIYPVLRFAKRVRNLSKLSQEKMGDINSILVETIGAVSVIKSFLLEKFKISKFMAQNLHFYQYMMKINKRIKAISPLTEFVCVGACSLILWVGGNDVIHHNLDPGGLIAFLGGILLLNKPLKKLSGIHNFNQQALSACERIYEVLDEKEETKLEQDLGLKVEAFETFKENIVFNHVFFKYQDEFILTDISFEVKKGEKIAIVGPSGAGKSTVLNLIPRFYESSAGNIRIDGIDLTRLSLSSLREKIATVSQDNILFNGTIKENIAYGVVGNDGVLFSEETGQFTYLQEKIESACKSAHAHEFIMKFPEGYNTIVGDRGMTLSGGERQRLSIARALLKDAPILILDEATSHLDAESEKLVQDALQVLMKGRTVLVVAHRFSTIKDMEKIIVLEKGKINSIGSHDFLIQNSPLYQKLYQTQFEI